MNAHEQNAEYTKSVIPQLEAIDKEFESMVKTGGGDSILYNLSEWHKDYFIDYGRLLTCALPKKLQYLVP